MRRNEREITDKSEIMAIFDRCNTVRLGLFRENHPYIVPLSFGIECNREEISLYFHCAKDGLKIDCLKTNPNVCVEADIFYKTEPLGKGITARYESVIGVGSAVEVFDDEKIHGLNLILKHYGYNSFDVRNCSNLVRTSVFKIVLDGVTGKRNLPTET